MRMRWLGPFTAILVSLLPAASRAELVAPHDASFTDADCSHCHSLYESTQYGGADYNAGCLACHANYPTSTLNFPAAGDEAVPGVKGSHHNFSGFAENPTKGAVKPTNTALTSKLVDGRIQCVTCHSMHTVNSAAAPDSRHTSATRVAGSSAVATLTIANAGTVSRGYRIRLQTKNTGTGRGTFIFTRSSRLATPVWFNWNGTAWYQGVVGGPGREYQPGVPVAVEDAAGPTVQWNVLGEIGDQWDVLVSYPGLRLALVDDYMCTYCHKPMVMQHARVAGLDANYPVDGVRMFSHPVGEALNANGLGTDHLEVLDVNGLPQSASGDANTSNDLKLGAGGVVRCTTCHAVHGGDSNSLTTDTK